MSGKLDQSLDDILKDRRQSARRPRGRRPNGPGKAATSTAAPVGGVKKATRAAKSAAKAVAPTGAPTGSGDSKIIVSNLPNDVTESQIKDYFTQTIGPVKKVLLTYGPNGQSRGVSTIIFSKPGSASEAAKKLDGVKVDERPMRVEVVLGAKDAPAPPPVKGLTERIVQPKSASKAQPKPATAAKGTTGKGSTRGRGRARGRNAGRGKPKTAQELDAEMQDYFGGNPNGAATAEGNIAMETNGGAVQPTTNGGDTGMEDEIL